MKSKNYSCKTARSFQPDPVNGSIESPMSWNLYTYVNNNALNYIDPFGLTQAWTSVPKGYGQYTPELSTGDNCPKDCPFDGKKCDCPAGVCDIDPETGQYLCSGETVEVIGKAIDDGNGLSDEEIKKYLPDEFFEEFNLIPFEVWAAQYSMNKGPWVFKPNYKDPVVQIMAQVASNVQPWLDFGESYLELSLSLLTFGPSFQNTKIILFNSPKGIGFKLISDISKKDLLKIAFHPGHKGGPHTYPHLFIYIRHLVSRQFPPF